jgi:hypothetical protein
MRAFIHGLAVAVALLPLPSLAATSEVQFQGDVSGLCTLALGVTGGLGLDANGDLSSTGHAAGTLVVLSVGSNTLTLNPPVWVSPAATYQAGTEHFYVATSGLAGLGLTDVPYQDTPIVKTISTLPLSVLSVNAKITNTLGFADGTYKAKVVVTCS